MIASKSKYFLNFFIKFFGYSNLFLLLIANLNFADLDLFEPIVGFNAEAHAQSLSWIIFNDLGGETRQLSAAATSSMLTIFGVAILLSPVLWRTWQDFKGKS